MKRTDPNPDHIPAITMKNSRLVLPIVASLLFLSMAQAQAPTITSFTPTFGRVGTAVTITGTNFSVTVANDLVSFGPVKGTVTAASATSLTVTVPPGAVYGPITVTNLATHLMAASAKPYTPTFAGNQTLTLSSYAPRVDFTAAATSPNPTSIASTDIDGDGKADMVVVNYSSARISFFRNTGTAGSVAFASRIDSTTGSAPNEVTVGDLDGDGKPDVAVVNMSSNSVSVYRNTSTSGTISFASRADVTTGMFPRNIHIADIDGDGRPDIVTSDASSSELSVLRNTSTPGTPSFAPRVAIASGQPSYLDVGDLDGDGKPDIVVGNTDGSNTIALHLNASTPGTISFATRVSLVTAGIPYGVVIGDMDGDGKADIAVAQNSVNTLSLFRNAGTGTGAFSFAARQDVALSTGGYGIAMGDMDGDGMPDLVLGSGTYVMVLKNQSTPGTLSFGSDVDLPSMAAPVQIAPGDYDGDGRQDIACANWQHMTFSVFRFNPAPSFPRNLAATAGSGQVTLRWNKNTDADFLRYRIYRSTSPSPTSLVDSTSGGISDTSRVIAGLTNGVTYYFRVTAADSAHLESGYSNEVNATPAVLAASREYNPDVNTVLLLHLDESGGTYVADASNHRNAGQADTVGTTVVSGRFGNGRQLSSTGGFIYVPHSASMNFGTGPFTWETWVKTPSLTAFVDLMGRTNIGLLMDVGGMLRGFLYDGTNSVNVSATWSIDDGKWHHAALIRTSATYSLYIDGALSGQVSAASIGNTDDPSNFGVSTGMATVGPMFDEIRLSSISRSPQEFGLQLPPARLSGSAAVLSANLAWQNGGGAIPVMRYKLYRGTDSTTLSPVDSTALTSISNTVPSAGPYFYRVSAVDSTGFEGARSYAVRIVISPANTAPNTPQNVTATAGGAQVTLRWNKNTEADFLKYRVYMGADSVTMALTDSTSSGIQDTTTTISGLTNGTRYYFRVTAMDSARLESVRSVAVGIAPNASIVPGGLVAWYPFSGTANDSSGNGYGGVNSGAVPSNDRFGSVNMSYAFDGNGSYVNVPNTESLNFATGGFALCAWIRLTGSQPGPIIGKHVDGIVSGYCLNVTNYGLEFYLGNVNTTPFTAAIDSNWHFVVGSYDGTTGRLYFDGQLVSTKVTPYSTTSPATIKIGSYHTPGYVNYFKGSIDDIRIYSRPLGATEVDTLYHERGWTGNVAPAAPQGLAATAGDAQVTLKWNRNAEADFLRYRVYRGTASPPTTRIDSTAGGIGDTTRTITGLANGTTYYFRTTAVDSAGLESAYSNEVSAMPQQSTIAPPTSLVATALVYNKVRVTWTDASNNETGFALERKTGAGGTYSSLANVGAGVQTYDDSTVAGSTVYFYHVRAFNATLTSAWSNEDSASTPPVPDVTPPGSPVAITINPAAWSTVSSFTVSWTNPSDPSGIARAWYSVGQAPTGGSPGQVVVLSQPSISVPVSSSGAVPIYVYLEDGVGNSNIASAVVVYAKRDVAAPLVAVDSAAVGTFTVGSAQAVAVPTTASDATSGVKSLALQYRRANAVWNSSDAVSYPSPVGGTAQIPLVFLQTNSWAGVEYRVSAADSAGNAATSNAHGITIQYSSTVSRMDSTGAQVLQPATSTLSQGTPSEYAYRMLSIPLNLSNKTPSYVLETQTGLGVYDNTRWRFYRWTATDAGQEYPDFKDESAIEPGRAFMLILKNPTQIKTGPGTLVRAEDFNTAGISIKSGYNAIGNPFNFDIPISDCSLVPAGMAATYWEFVGAGGTNGGWKSAPSRIKAWEGIILVTNQPGTLRFTLPSGPSILPAPMVMNGGATDESGWRVRIRATRLDNGVQDEENVIGAASSATDGVDAQDLFEPPLFGSKSISVQFSTGDVPLTHDLRKLGEEGYVWEMKVKTTDQRTPVRMRIEGPRDAPGKFFLVDEDLRTSTMLEGDKEFSFSSGGGTRSYRLIVGSESFARANNGGISLIPQTSALLQNFPNPFNPSTEVRFDVARRSHIRISAYNPLGQEVERIVDEECESGYYVRTWQPRLASGVYLLRFEAHPFEGEKTPVVQVRKTILLK